MSKIGFLPVVIKSGVQVNKEGNKIIVKGPNGELKVEVPTFLEVEIKEQQLLVQRKNNDKKTRSMHGLVRMLIANAIEGVVTPWKKVLEIQGVGFRAEISGQNLQFKLGFSHPIVFVVPNGLKAEVKNNKITLSGIDKQQVGEVAAKIKALKKPDKYKGKGIRYEGEVIKLKPGKKAKAGA